jgi:hypothetical protein
MRGPRELPFRLPYGYLQSRIFSGVCRRFSPQSVEFVRRVDQIITKAVDDVLPRALTPDPCVP